MEQIDRIAIAPLKERYGHRKFYTEYLPALGIQTTKDGKNAYITGHEAELLEKYHEARGRGKEAVAEFLAQLGKHVPEYVPHIPEPIPKHVPIRAHDISRIELLRMAGTLQEMNSVARWLATDWVLQTAAMQQIVIIRPVLLVFLDRDKLPRLKRFCARGYEFRRVDDRSNKEWLAEMVEISNCGRRENITTPTQSNN
ncbi:hypothetical protein LC605_27785 [Nostoc sp. CHAB 5836]|uniref:hypothetical protein n=1 Tax=Nostoc sp. CHAB 5836 TaxID=2780404 RepID=UPI001E2FA37C|nr:hypothetical protein [Nostoc sp. CHAB 5836]MCC5618821.1 hypothetical protein [Nostoc sp. CHAB 5836]